MQENTPVPETPETVTPQTPPPLEIPMPSFTPDAPETVMTPPPVPPIMTPTMTPETVAPKKRMSILPILMLIVGIVVGVGSMVALGMNTALLSRLSSSQMVEQMYYQDESFEEEEFEDEEEFMDEEILMVDDSFPEETEFDLTIPEYWKEVHLEKLGMRFMAPINFPATNYSEQIEGDAGSSGWSRYNYCLTSTSNDRPCLYSVNGADIHISGLLAGAVAEYGTGPTDTTGFVEENGKYYPVIAGIIQRQSDAEFTKITNSHGVEILFNKLDDTTEGYGGSGGFGRGFGFGAIINTKNPTYPGVYMNIQRYSEETARKIIDSIRFE